LPGAGKPIPGLGRPFTAERWAVEWIRREGGEVSAILPPPLLFRRERASLLSSLAEFPSETVLRETVVDFNRRLLDQYRRPMDGPLIAVGVLDVEETVAAWRATRPPRPRPPPAAPPPRRRWWRRRAT